MLQYAVEEMACSVTPDVWLQTEIAIFLKALIHNHTAFRTMGYSGLNLTSVQN